MGAWNEPSASDPTENEKLYDAIGHTVTDEAEHRVSFVSDGEGSRRVSGTSGYSEEASLFRTMSGSKYMDVEVLHQISKDFQQSPPRGTARAPL
jgi:hypothetical protein